MFFQHTNGCGRTEHHGHFVFLNQTPPNATIGACRQAFVKNGGHAANQGAVNDVAVTDHPTDVAGAEKCFAWLTAKNIGDARSQGHCIATRVTLDPFGLARRARGVQGVTWMGGIDPLAGHHVVHVFFAQRGPKQITSLNHVHACQTTFDQHH